VSGIMYAFGAFTALWMSCAASYLGKTINAGDAMLVASFFLIGKAAETR
jgi:hypothetical protein